MTILGTCQKLGRGRGGDFQLTLSLPRGSPLIKLSGVRQSKIYNCNLALTGVKGLSNENKMILPK